jgi:hypothetical protein
MATRTPSRSASHTPSTAAKAPARARRAAAGALSRQARKTAAAHAAPKAAAPLPQAAPAKPTKAAKSAKPVKSPKAAKPQDKPKKPKLVRDSFTIPKPEYEAIAALKLRAAKLGQTPKKSELLRAGLKALAAMGDAALLDSLTAVPSIKTGRPAA